MSKFPEHRDAVENALTFDTWKSVVDNVYDSLVKAAHITSTTPDSYEQVRNVGRGNMQHATFLMLMSKSLNVMRKLKVMPKVKMAHKTRKLLTTSRSKMKRKTRNCSCKAQR